MMTKRWYQLLLLSMGHVTLFATQVVPKILEDWQIIQQALTKVQTELTQAKPDDHETIQKLNQRSMMLEQLKQQFVQEHPEFSSPPLSQDSTT